LVLGREVRPRRAREAFCRCAQALFMAAMPILEVGGRAGLYDLRVVGDVARDPRVVLSCLFRSLLGVPLG
jgi:hypothetical protein